MFTPYEIRFCWWDLLSIISNERIVDWKILHTNNWQCELMQFTWLKDKNWKEIYEGDIVNLEWVWNETVWFQDWSFMTGYACLMDIFTKQIEVIWNIYENPKLLSNQ